MRLTVDNPLAAPLRNQALGDEAIVVTKMPGSLQVIMRYFPRRFVASGFALVIVFTGTGCGAGVEAPSPTSKFGAGAAASGAAGACRSDPHQGVHDPQRLTILSACAEVVGTVVRVPRVPPDGDHTFNVRLDPAYVGMMNAQNQKDGGIHVEIVPMDQPGCTRGQQITTPAGYNNLGVCSGANVMTPSVGARVRVTGPFVHDDWSGPNEIHPAWQVEILPPDFPTVTTAPSTTVPAATTPSAPKPLVLKVRLTGRAIIGAKGAPRGTAAVVLTITPPELCWRFTGVRHIGTPTLARISIGRAGYNGHRVVALGATYKPRGCTTANVDSLLEPLSERPARYYVTISSKAYPAGAVRGQLARVRP